MKDKINIDDLIDQYVLGKMSPEEKEEMESLIFCSPELQKMVEERKALVKVVKGNPELTRPSKSSSGKIMSFLMAAIKNLIILISAYRWTIGGIVVAAVAVFMIFILPPMDSENSASQSGTDYRSSLRGAVTDENSPSVKTLLPSPSATYHHKIPFEFENLPANDYRLTIHDARNNLVLQQIVHQSQFVIDVAALEIPPGKYRWILRSAEPDSTEIDNGDFTLDRR